MLARQIIEKINSFDSLESLEEYYYSLGDDILKYIPASHLNIICSAFYNKKRELLERS